MHLFRTAPPIQPVISTGAGQFYRPAQRRDPCILPALAFTKAEAKYRGLSTPFRDKARSTSVEMTEFRVVMAKSRSFGFVSG
jgi:hypothetical protein